jgi:hypothetical protein
MEKSSQIAWKIVPLRHFFPLKVVPLIEVLLYICCRWTMQRSAASLLIQRRRPSRFKSGSRTPALW